MLREFLIKASAVGVHLDLLAGKKLLEYLALLRRWNKVHNFCAEASYQTMLSYHILDSISVAGAINLKNKACLDVGTGPGLPGLLLAIVEPTSSIVLLDAKTKKIVFVKHAINVLKLANTKAVASTIEQFKWANNFDVIVSRAFAALPKFVASVEHLCADNGILVAMKSSAEGYKTGDNVGRLMRVIQIVDVAVPGVCAPRKIIVLGKKQS